MIELLFVISMLDGSTIKEFFPDSFATIIECQDEGWLRAEKYKDEIKQKHPNMSGFDIECRQKRIEV